VKLNTYALDSYFRNIPSDTFDKQGVAFIVESRNDIALLCESLKECGYFLTKENISFTLSDSSSTVRAFVCPKDARLESIYAEPENARYYHTLGGTMLSKVFLCVDNVTAQEYEYLLCRCRRKLDNDLSPIRFLYFR